MKNENAKRNKKYVFISASDVDGELTDQLIKLLNRNGIPTEYDRMREWNENRGAEFNDILEESLEKSTAAISLVTEDFLSSQFFHSEANYAIGVGKPLILAVKDGIEISSLPRWAQKLQVIHFPSEREKLLAAIVLILMEDDITSEGTRKTHTNPSFEEDKTPFHKDSPSFDDYLGRRGFVEALAQWTDRYWTEYQTAEKSFIINIHGQWGAGKTTFLNLLQDELQNNSTNDWTVVWFNAWENRHIKPEWWPLLDKIYRDSISQKKAKGETVWHIKLREWWWRFYSGRKLDLLGFIASLVLLAFVLFWVMRTGFLPENHFLARVEAVAKPISAIFAALSTIFLGTKFISRTVSFGSAKAAEVYLQFTPDPIENIKRHFDDLIEKKINKPVIVFIDDLDRCDRGYIVNLLESVQTLLNHKKVFYVIAADQRWLFAAFDENYKEFKDSIKEPGKKIGYLFLEKIFQLSMSIPRISDESRAVYLDYLLGKKGQIEEKREQARKIVEDIESEQGLIDEVQSQESGSIEKVLIREAAVSKSASLEIEKETVHFLTSFAHLMEPNPRAIKRLVTFYGVQRAIAILSDEEIISNLEKRNQLALWTIVKMRWPLLADYLEEYPQYLDTFKKGELNNAIHPDVNDLINEQEVMDVLTGKGISVELDGDALKRFIRLKATERTF